MHSSAQNNQYDTSVVAAQLQRSPRSPWRVGARCRHGYPSVIVSPSLLDDGARFPNYGYLTCPHLCEEISSFESSGAIALWAERLRHDELAAQNQYQLEEVLKEARREECLRCDQEVDLCAEVGIAGQRTTLGVKCLHIHVAYALLGLNDCIGREILTDLSMSEPFGCSCVDAKGSVCAAAAATLLRHESMGE